MKSATLIIGTGLLAAATAGAGYWWGQRSRSPETDPVAVTAATTSPLPESAASKRKVLFYRNPMGLPDTSPTPKKDSMGMEYVPVYEGDDSPGPDSQNQIKISTEKVQKLGVKTEAASLRRIEQAVRVAGRIVPDERRVFAISPKFDGYVERLDVSLTGQPVARGQPLFEAYSPDLVAAQGEYLVAAKGMATQKGASEKEQRDLQALVDASLLRLRNWDVPDDELKALGESGQVRHTLTFRSPVTGVVTEKKALQGMRFASGEPLYQVTDLSTVWVIADVFEQDIGSVRLGARARVKLAAYPDQTFNGTVTYIYPTLTPETRTVPVRIELPNPGQRLKPAMFAQVELRAAAKSPSLVVPTSAVIDSGVRRVVLVQAGEGRFEPREVSLGQRGDDLVEILDGVKEGERVVVSANFLIDAESNLKAAIGGFAAAAAGHSHGAQGGQDAPAATVASESSARVGHSGRGTIAQLDPRAGTVLLGHGPIEALNMPAMTMQFKVANASLLDGLKTGATVDFEFVERGAGEWVITRFGAPEAGPPTGGDAAQSHQGH